ncbi:hypothetical protein V495_02010 [Pseudogymnoascus sp. VKM F-4514 (FW-929)]|nr:hypothetical protein V490_07374 [Pseudogymnoascus sp. VKM F-3557]KFY47318.1 hypothetical protein V495_02010 [Pseudogymnoascus sp. VKM F-4514 (FW-929)]KFY64681.1 hypothetical protein V497_01621 [Pseudogymnoascus sp. VKM F-4516 (FW-969)]
MAQKAITGAQVLPRFLLPQLSWQGRAATAQLPVRRTSLFAAYSTDSYGQNRHATTITPQRSMFQRKDGAAITQNLPMRRAFSSSPMRSRDHHFDTLKFVKRLKDEGFTETQSVAMMKVLSDVIEESIQNLTRTMVIREDQAKATYTQKVDFAKLRSELLSADATEESATKAAHESLTNDLAKFNNKLRDEISRTQASVRLDLNLEKGRIREESNSQGLKIKETETKIEQEVAALREKLEGVKFQTLQWLMGVVTGFSALVLVSAHRVGVRGKPAQAAEQVRKAELHATMVSGAVAPRVALQ